MFETFIAAAAGVFGGFYLAGWVTAIVAFYSMYVEKGEYEDGSALLGAIFFGPLIFLVEVPKFVKTVASLISARLGKLRKTLNESKG